LILSSFFFFSPSFLSFLHLVGLRVRKAY
jgi:hypothetical protein